MASSAFIFCKQCGAKNARDAQTCEQCGAALHTPPAPPLGGDAAATQPSRASEPRSIPPDALPTSPLTPAGSPALPTAAPAAPVPGGGKPVVGIVFCSRCGAKNPRDSQYCDQCSAPLQGGPPAPMRDTAATMPGFSRPTASAPAGPATTLPGLTSPPAPATRAEDALGRATAAASAAASPPPARAIGPPPVSVAPPAAPAPPLPTHETLPAMLGVPPVPAGKTVVMPARPAKPAKRGGLPLPLIAGALVTLLIFVGIGFFALNGVSNSDPQNDVRTAVAQQATVQAQQGAQIQVALTQLAENGGSLSAQRTAVIQATAAAVEAQATTTAIIAQVAAIAADKKAAGEAKGIKEVVVPAVFAPAQVRAFITPVVVGTAGTFSGPAGGSAESAARVAVPVTITNKLLTSGDAHFYRIDLSKYTGGTLRLTFTAPRAAKGSITLHLMDEAGVNDLTTKYVNPAATETVLTTLQPGSYVIKIEGSTDPQNPYTLGIGFNANGASADKDHAVPLNLVGSVQGFLNSSKDVHWYRVDMSQFPQGGQFTTALTLPAAIKGDVQLHLVDPGGGTDVHSVYVYPGKNNLVSDEADSAKNYYIEVESDGAFSATEPYVLATVFQPHSAAGTPGNAVKITAPVLTKIRIATPNDVVFMQFEIKGPAKATFRVTMPTDGSEVAVAITDSNNQTTYGSSYVAPGQKKESTAQLPAPGIYLLRVGGDGGNATSLKPVQVELQIDAVK